MTELSLTRFRCCTKCGITYPAERTYFYGQSTGKYGLAAECKPCRKARIKVHESQSPDKVKERYQRWVAKNPERAKAIQRKYIETHRDELREKNREAARSPQQRQKQQEWVEQNRAKVREIKRRWKERNADLVKLQQRVDGARRRARFRQAEGNHTYEDILTLYELQEGLCYYCKTILNEQYHVEHKVPLCRGGTNDPANLVCSCPLCNSRKGDKTEEEFLNRYPV